MAGTAPLDLIETGLKEGSLVQIAKGFEKLTGKKVKPPKQPAGKTRTVTKTVVQESIPEGVRAVLGFYSNDANWKFQGTEFDPKPSVVANDRGKKAREVLLWPEPTHENFPEPAPAVVTEVTARSKPDFRIQHGGVTEQAKNYARKEPFKPAPNTFVDDGQAEAKEIETDRKMTAKIRPSVGSRPAVTTEKVKMQCGKCGASEEVHPADARRTVEGETSTFVCQGCIRKMRPS